MEEVLKNLTNPKKTKDEVLKQKYDPSVMPLMNWRSTGGIGKIKTFRKMKRGELKLCSHFVTHSQESAPFADPEPDTHKRKK